MRYVCYSYDIPKNIPPEEYPAPSLVLRRFAVRMQQSVWIVPDTMVSRTETLSDDIQALPGGKVRVFRFDLEELAAIKAEAQEALESEANRIRTYIEKAIAKTTERLTAAQRAMSVADTNAAIRYQQTSLANALREINDAEECAVAFDLTGSLAELMRSVRSVIEARAEAFVVVKDAARAAVNPVSIEAVDPAALGFGLPTGPAPVVPGQTTLPGLGGTGTGG
jgi:hypothetical protein